MFYLPYTRKDLELVIVCILLSPLRFTTAVPPQPTTIATIAWLRATTASRALAISRAAPSRLHGKDDLAPQGLSQHRRTEQRRAVLARPGRRPPKTKLPRSFDKEGDLGHCTAKYCQVDLRPGRLLIPPVRPKGVLVAGAASSGTRAAWLSSSPGTGTASAPAAGAVSSNKMS